MSTTAWEGLCRGWWLIGVDPAVAPGHHRRGRVGDVHPHPSVSRWLWEFNTEVGPAKSLLDWWERCRCKIATATGGNCAWMRRGIVESSDAHATLLGRTIAAWTQVHR